MIYVYNTVLNKACSCRRKRKAQTPKGTGKRAEARAPTLFLPQGKTLFFHFVQHYTLSLARFEAKDWYTAAQYAVLESYLACSAKSSLNRQSPHSNAHHQVPPVQSRILSFAYLSNRWWMLLIAFIKASNNLHSKTKDDWWVESNKSNFYRFLKSVLSFSNPQPNFQKLKTSRMLIHILNFGCS